MQPTLTQTRWIESAMFYQIYPLGLCDAPHRNDFQSPPNYRIERLYGWIDHIAGLGLNAVLFNPVFESSAHGYDTADYFHIDRRLGDNASFARLTQAMKARGLRVVLDGVFHHVGRDFWAFRDVRARGQASPYHDWFAGLDFGRRSPYGDPFAYEGWDGHYSLVKLNLHHPDVRRHLFDAVTFWIEAFDIDGLRLDAADKLDFGFMSALAAHCRAIKPDFWLMGEVVHGDYRHWANPSMLDATTNYECYKGLYSSHVDQNYFEIAYAFNRQFGGDGIYRDIALYNFADNHDVNRVASSLKHAAHLYPLHILLFTMPGVPSIYYGSEWGLAGMRTPQSDRALRPALELARIVPSQPDLTRVIRRLADIRAASGALRYGSYRQLHVNHQQFAYLRATAGETVVVAVNADAKSATIHLHDLAGNRLIDMLNGNTVAPINGGTAALTLHPCWGGVFAVE